MSAEALVLDLLASSNRPYNVQASRCSLAPAAAAATAAAAAAAFRARVPCHSPQGVADMLATKGVKKAAAEKALDALAEKGKVVRLRVGGTALLPPAGPSGRDSRWQLGLCPLRAGRLAGAIALLDAGNHSLVLHSVC